MKPGLRTLLRTLTGLSSPEIAQTTTFVIPTQPSQPSEHPPPRVQPRLPSSTFFHGRDHFTTEELIRHRLDRSKRAILRKPIPSFEEHPDISAHASDWSHSDPPFSWNFAAARLCDRWRNEGVIELEVEDLEDQQRRDRMEKRVVRSLEPEYTRAIDKLEFARAMEMRFGWREGVDMPTGVVGDTRGRNNGRLSHIRNADGGSMPDERRRERAATQWPSPVSMFLPPGQNVPAVSSLENYPLSSSYAQVNPMESQHKELQLPCSKQYKAMKNENAETLLERLQHAAAQKNCSPKRLMPDRDPFADNAYPRPSYSTSSGYSSFRRAGRQPEGRKPSPELFMSREAEPPGPSLVTPFSWPEVQSSPPSTRPVPPLPVSERSFIDVSRNEIASVYDRMVLGHVVSAIQMPPKCEDCGNNGVGKIGEPPTVVAGGRKDNLSLQNEIRASRARRERAQMAEEAFLAKKNQGVGSWLRNFW